MNAFFPPKVTRRYALGLMVVLGTCQVAGASDKVDYNRDVRPILSAHCFFCHGPDEAHRQADLRLDEADNALEDRGGYAALVPGDPEASELFQRIMTDDADLKMPPEDIHKPLNEDQIETLRRWIKQGGEYQAHWAFIPPVKREPPADPTDWSRNPIDNFVRAKLAEQKATPSQAAKRHVLARRVTLDLTGLPPTPEDIKQFLADSDESAYEKIVEKLLESPHFGERMALDWLDAARYADTNGYSIDGGRHMWLWRDWVIDAFNRNLPYDDFLRQQIAGDLLPDANDATLIASGFQRNNMVTHEGGTIPEENLVNYNADRVKTLGEAVLGLTLACAQCHDHKYDPITQREYYQLFAYFNTIEDKGLDGNWGVNPAPYRKLRTVLQTAEETELEQQIKALKKKLGQPEESAVTRWAQQQAEKLQERGKDLQLHPVRLTRISTPNSGAGFAIEKEKFVTVTKPTGFLAYDVVAELKKLEKPITGLRIVVHPQASASGVGWGHGIPSSRDGLSVSKGRKDSVAEKSTFVLTALSVSASASPAEQVSLHGLKSFASVTASSWAEGFRPEFVRDPRRHNGWSPADEQTGPAELTVTFDEPIDSANTPHLTLQFNFGFGHRLIARRFEVQAITGRDDGSDLPEEIIATVLADPPTRTSQQLKQLAGYYSSHAEDTAPLRVELANLQDRLRSLTEQHPTMVMHEATKPRPTFLLTRGDYQQPAERVEPATPAVLPPAPEGTAANRLGLARWLTQREHPLTARVAVNRIWKLFFGRGLVATEADFGAQGAYPSHPALLDWLTVDFVESGWDVKRLVRQIVLSATYRQSSVPTPELLEDDPENRWLGRGPRFRLQAEFIRDSALQASGLLVRRIGGPSVNPYAPGDLWREVSHYASTPATGQAFVQDHGEKLYRRSLYTYWKRTSPPPNLATFDAPNRETCVIARQKTNTPLQALVLLNDVQFVEAARKLAERMMNHSDESKVRIEWAYREVLSRPPSPEEAAVLVDLFRREHGRFRKQPLAAKRLLAMGESPRDVGLDPVEHAAWTQVAAVILNLSETITRN